MNILNENFFKVKKFERTKNTKVTKKGIENLNTGEKLSQ